MNPETSQSDNRCEDSNSQSKILHFKQCKQSSVVKPRGAWFHCLLQDSIICKMVSYMGIKSSPWALELCQLDPPLAKAWLWAGINTWLCMEWSWLHMECSQLFSSPDPGRNSEYSVFKDCTLQERFFVSFSILCFSNCVFSTPPIKIPEKCHCKLFFK